MTAQAIDFGLTVPLVTNRTGDLTQMRFMGVTVGEILGRRPGNQGINIAVTGQATVVFNGIPFFGDGLTMAGQTNHLGLIVAGIQVS